MRIGFIDDVPKSCFAMGYLNKKIKQGLILSVVGTVLCPVVGVFPLVLSIIAIKKDGQPKSSTIMKWVYVLLVIEALLLIVGAVHLITSLLGAGI